MAYSIRTANWRIPGAVLGAVLLVGGAYVIARGAAHPPVAEASTEAALLAQIATKDSDGDSLPDWEEALYGTDPHKVDTKGLGMSDGEAVAKGLIVPNAEINVPSTNEPTTLGLPTAKDTSLTNAFAKQFFGTYLTAKQQKGSDLSQDEISQLAAQNLSIFLKAVAATPDFKKDSELSAQGTGPDALRAYAIAAENVFAAHTVSLPKSELDYLDAFITGDSTAVEQIKQISAAYHDIAVGLSALQVPQEAASSHLQIVNSMYRLGAITADFARVNDDPLATMLALSQYGDTLVNLLTGFSQVSPAFTKEGVTIQDGSPGAYFVNLTAHARARTSP